MRARFVNPPRLLNDSHRFLFNRALVAMAELARQIIRQQWPLRHHPEARLRDQARSLIRTHVLMLREWRKGSRGF